MAMPPLTMLHQPSKSALQATAEPNDLGLSPSGPTKHLPCTSHSTQSLPPPLWLGYKQFLFRKKSEQWSLEGAGQQLRSRRRFLQ